MQIAKFYLDTKGRRINFIIVSIIFFATYVHNLMIKINFADILVVIVSIISIVISYRVFKRTEAKGDVKVMFNEIIFNNNLIEKKYDLVFRNSGEILSLSKASVTFIQLILLLCIVYSLMAFHKFKSIRFN